MSINDNIGKFDNYNLSFSLKYDTTDNFFNPTNGNLNKLDFYDWIPSAYGTGNYKERFAETFVQYIFSPVELKKASPSAYKWIEETLDASLKIVDKWN